MKYNIDDAIQFASWSKLAYGNDSLPIGPKYVWLDGLKSNPSVDVQVLVIIKENDRIIFSGRGTHDIREFFLDANIKFKKVDNDGGVKVHTGFYNGVNSIWLQFLKVVDENPNLPVYTTGHSLGAALARQITYRLATEKNILVKESITFGEPRSFNHKGKISYEKFLIPTWRIMDENDIVCRVPWRLGMYKHVGNSIFYDAWGNMAENEPWFAHLPSDMYGIIKEALHKKDALIYDHNIDLYIERLKQYKENFLI